MYREAQKLKMLTGLDFIEGHGETFEMALEHTGFGIFNYLLLATCGLVYLNTAVGITIISFVLPSATCDFEMSSADKGWLTASPMFGMLIGSYFWGCLADTKGRKVVLIGALLMDGICGLLSSICQAYWLFTLLRFLNGFAISGALGICYTYLGEFQPSRYRQTILCWMELFWTGGVILLPGIAWIIIPMQIPIYTPDRLFKLSSWNLFVATCSLPSVVLGLWLFYFPESPKFLLECGESEEALKVLRRMYRINTGEPDDDFPTHSFRERSRTHSIVSQLSTRSVRSLSMRKPKDLKLLLREVWEQTKVLCAPPHLRYTVITCLIQFGVTASYYTLMLWFPELFNRFYDFEKANPGQSASVCEVSSVVLSSNKTEGHEEFCGEPIGDSVFMNTLIIGLASIPHSIWLPLCVSRLGAKFFLVSGLLLASGVTLGLYFVNSTTSNLVMSCLFEALTSLSVSTVYCVLVDLFPTHLRVMACALSLTAGRTGALIGNLLFGFLIDMNCVVPIILFSLMLLGSGLLCLLLPRTGVDPLD